MCSAVLGAGKHISEQPLPDIIAKWEKNEHTLSNTVAATLLVL